MPIARTSIVFTLVLGALSALPPLGIDMSLPGLPAIAQSLQASAVAAGATLSLFLLGYATGPLLFGPLSDRVGRRPVLLGGVAVFAGAGLMCALAPSIGWLLVGRLFQGIGAGIGAALPLAIVRDLFEGTAARARLCQLTLVFSLGPLLAPTLGSMVIPLGGWRGIYFTTGMIGVLLLLSAIGSITESLPPARRRSMRPQELLKGYCHVLGQPIAVGFALINALSYGCLFAFISGSPLVLIHGRGLSALAFSAVFACAMLGLIGAAFLGGRLAKRGIPSARVLLLGLLLGVSSTMTLLVLSLTGHDTLAAMIPLLLISNASYGLTGPTAVHEALAPMEAIAGLASAVLRGIQIVTGALVSALVPLLYASHSSSVAMTAVMAACPATALMIYVLHVRRANAATAAGALRLHNRQPPRPVGIGS